MTRRVWLAVLVAAGTVVVVGVALLGGEAGGGAPDVPTHRVAAATFQREVPADGNLEAVEATPLLAPAQARMPLKIAWVVKDGTRVEAGDVVVKFDPNEMKQHLRDGEATVLQAKKRIAKEQTSAGSTGRKREREAELAESEMKAAEAFEFDDQEVFSRNEVIESQIDTDLAEARMEHARSAKQIERSVSSGKLDVLRVQERQAQMAVDRAEQALTTTELTAPASGIVLLHRDWRGRRVSVGDTAWPGQKVAEVPQDDAMQAKVYVLEADGGGLEAGMKATVLLESLPGREYEATIERVDTIAQPRIPEVPVQYFAVVLALAETDAAHMKIGQRVRATILLEAPEAIAVPRQAVFVDGKQAFVYRKTAGGFERVEVELGAGTAGRVIIAKGLSEGDEIALREPVGVTDGGMVAAPKQEDADAHQ